MKKPWANQAVLQAVSNAADACFKQTMPTTGTREDWEAAIDVWNTLLDHAIANAKKVKDECVIGAKYDHAAIARDMIDYFEVMKATKDAPFTPRARVE